MQARGVEQPMLEAGCEQTSAEFQCFQCCTNKPSLLQTKLDFGRTVLACSKETLANAFEALSLYHHTHMWSATEVLRRLTVERCGLCDSLALWNCGGWALGAAGRGWLCLLPRCDPMRAGQSAP